MKGRGVYRKNFACASGVPLVNEKLLQGAQMLHGAVFSKRAPLFRPLRYTCFFLRGMVLYEEMGKKFSIAQRIKSFGHAARGIGVAFKTQHNIRIHAAAVIIVGTAGIFFKLSLLEWGLVVMAVGLVLVSEMMNTAIEALVDLVSPSYHEKAGLIKDIAAGAVMIAAVISVIIGLVVFVPKVLRLFEP